MGTARPLRTWQEQALDAWLKAKRRGIVSVVTGGGKTYFALNCIAEIQRAIPAVTTLITVPTEALLDQWFEEIVSFFDLPPDFINYVTGRRRLIRGRINIGVINTVAKLGSTAAADLQLFLVVDECHRSASPVLRGIFDLPRIASLGLSATPERQYDNWFSEVLIPNLGPIIYSYSYKNARRDGVIVPFSLNNILFDLSAAEKREYDRLTKCISRAIGMHGIESQQAVQLLLKRARQVNSCPARVKIALKLIARHRDERVLVFHEDIQSCEAIHGVLMELRVSAAIYHSQMPMSEKIKTLHSYRTGQANILVSCRALDEGFNVPESEVAIIAASTASYRQRIQRLGRVLRPSPGKDRALVYSIVASEPEVRRLVSEAEDLAEIAEVIWSRA